MSNHGRITDEEIRYLLVSDGNVSECGDLPDMDDEELFAEIDKLPGYINQQPELRLFGDSIELVQQSDVEKILQKLKISYLPPLIQILILIYLITPMR